MCSIGYGSEREVARHRGLYCILIREPEWKLSARLCSSSRRVFLYGFPSQRLQFFFTAFAFGRLLDLVQRIRKRKKNSTTQLPSKPFHRTLSFFLSFLNIIWPANLEIKKSQISRLCVLNVVSACNNFCFTLLAKEPANIPLPRPSAAVPLAECLGPGQLSWLQSGGLRRSQGGRKEKRVGRDQE